MSSNKSNISQTLSSLFEEMLLPQETTENRSNLDITHFLSALKGQSSRNTSHEPLDFGTLVKIVDGWRTRLNLTRPAEATCNYCEGNFRDVILAYNAIHGYFSLIVSFWLLSLYSCYVCVLKLNISLQIMFTETVLSNKKFLFKVSSDNISVLNGLPLLVFLFFFIFSA